MEVRSCKGKYWYADYQSRRMAAEKKKQIYDERCKSLGVEPTTIKDEIKREIIARIVHESNWQEDLYLNLVRTKELSDAVFDDPISIVGPHLDLNSIVEGHKQRVIEMKRNNATAPEIAAHNLARGHVAIAWLYRECQSRLEAFTGLFVNRLIPELEKLLSQYKDYPNSTALS